MSKYRIITLGPGERIKATELARIVAPPDNPGKAAKRIRGIARSAAVSYRDVTKNRNEPHLYDAATANRICEVAGYPVRVHQG